MVAAKRFDNLGYRWECEPPFDTYCDGMSEENYTAGGYGPDDCARIADRLNPTISFSDRLVEACGGRFCEERDPPVSCWEQGAEYEVWLRVEYTGDTAAFGEKDKGSSFSFYDVAAPAFRIEAPETLLVSATSEQALDLWWHCGDQCTDPLDREVGYSSDIEYFNDYRVKWDFEPGILSGIVYQTQKLYKIPVGVLDAETHYTATVVVKHKTYGSRAQATESYTFTTGYVPRYGQGEIVAVDQVNTRNELGEEFIAKISGWEYREKEGGTLKWRMWATIPLGDWEDDEVPKVQKNFPITPTW